MNIKSFIKRSIVFLLKKQYITKVVIQTATSRGLLKNKNIIITGGSRGLGYSIAKKALEEGANVLIVGRDKTRLMDAAKSLGNNCHYLTFDISNIQDIPEFIVKCVEKFNGNKIDCLVANAGIYIDQLNDYHDVSEEKWDKLFNVNLKGNYFCVKYFIEYLERCKNTSGNIVVISSERAIAADDTPYGLTKVAVNSFIRGFAVKVIDKNIRVNGIAPSVMATDMGHYKKDGNMYLANNIGKRAFLPEEMTEIVTFLLSDISASINGEIITCNQGNYIVKK